MRDYFFVNFQGLLLAHDHIAQRELQCSEDQQPPEDDFNIPHLPDVGSSIKIVHLEKTTEPLVNCNIQLLNVCAGM